MTASLVYFFVGGMCHINLSTSLSMPDAIKSVFYDLRLILTIVIINPKISGVNIPLKDFLRFPS